MPKRSTKRKSRRRVPRRLLLVAGALIGLSLLCCTGLYLYASRKVARQLDARGSERIPAIYSDTFTLAAHSTLDPNILRQEMLRRRYREVSEAPRHPGEFRTKGQIFEISTREFVAADGKTVPSRVLEFEAESGGLSSGGAALESVELEPAIVSNLGTGEQRASNYKRLAEIPDFVSKAVLAIEDERFYEHHGVDIIGVLRAVVQNVRALSWVQGGSTITQQLAKNLLFSPEKTLGRKVLEMASAVAIERRLSKSQILEMYLNEVYLGQEGAVAIHGVAEAADAYFGKKIDELSLSEAALLAGLIKAPSYFAPRKHLDRSLNRRDVVLQKMLDLEVITPQQYQLALAHKPQIVAEREHKRDAQFFVAAIKQELDAHLNVDAALLTGLKVYTGLDPYDQDCAEEAIHAGMETVEHSYPKSRTPTKRLEAALVSIESFSGKVRAWVGGRDFSDNQFNHVSQARRQVGSTIKPFLYLTALDANLNSYKVATATSVLTDAPMQLNLVNNDVWEPENYDRQFRGDVTLRYALENSLNIPAVYVAQRVGIDAVARTVRQFHISPQVLAVPALALGALDTSLLDLTAAYAALANGGIYVTPRLYTSALDNAADTMTSSEIHEERVAGEDPVYVLTNILQGVVERGTGAAVRKAGYTGQAAGKTGTSNDARDAWFLGFTPTLTTGVWVGFDDNSKIGLTGGKIAAPIWGQYMKCVSKLHPDTAFVPPPGVVFTDVDVGSGQRATPACPRESVTREVFVRGTEPQVPCRLHGGYHDEVVEPAPEPHPERERRRRRSIWDMIFG